MLIMSLGEEEEDQMRRCVRMVILAISGGIVEFKWT